MLNNIRFLLIYQPGIIVHIKSMKECKKMPYTFKLGQCEPDNNIYNLMQIGNDNSICEIQIVYLFKLASDATSAEDILKVYMVEVDKKEDGLRELSKLLKASGLYMENQHHVMQKAPESRQQQEDRRRGPFFERRATSTGAAGSDEELATQIQRKIDREEAKIEKQIFDDSELAEQLASSRPIPSEKTLGQRVRERLAKKAEEKQQRRGPSSFSPQTPSAQHPSSREAEERKEVRRLMEKASEGNDGNALRFATYVPSLARQRQQRVEPSSFPPETRKAASSSREATAARKEVEELMKTAAEGNDGNALAFCRYVP